MDHSSDSPPKSASFNPSSIANTLVNGLILVGSFYALKWSYKFVSWNSDRRQKKREAKARKILEKSSKNSEPKVTKKQVSKNSHIKVEKEVTIG